MIYDVTMSCVVVFGLSFLYILRILGSKFMNFLYSIHAITPVVYLLCFVVFCNSLVLLLTYGISRPKAMRVLALAAGWLSTRCDNSHRPRRRRSNLR
uniref:Uncharacterized protein n=1 Tax=Trichogramma kaykai TaxID=54128 RepID=A0ABD2WSV6_9HYME